MVVCFGNRSAFIQRIFEGRTGIRDVHKIAFLPPGRLFEVCIIFCEDFDGRVCRNFVDDHRVLSKSQVRIPVLLSNLYETTHLENLVSDGFNGIDKIVVDSHFLVRN